MIKVILSVMAKVIVVILAVACLAFSVKVISDAVKRRV